jgi:hypothetical protein
MFCRVNLSGLLVVLLATLASQAAAFGYGLSRAPDAALVAFIAQGGNPQDICDGSDGGSGPHDHLLCGTCVVVGQTVLSTPYDGPRPERSIRVATQLQFTAEAPPPARRSPGWPVRGPPQT